MASETTPRGNEVTWTCIYCTYQNPTLSKTRCDICQKLRPRSGRSRADEQSAPCPAKKRVRTSFKSKKELFQQAETSTTPMKCSRHTQPRCTSLSDQPHITEKTHRRTTPSHRKPPATPQIQTEVGKCVDILYACGGP